MVKKPRMVRTFARTATKAQEKHLIDNAKKLYDDPLLILPDFGADECRKYFAKTQKRLQKIHQFRDDVSKLEKLANRRGLEGALAGSLLIAQAEKAPYLAVLKFPTGTVVYAQRGKAEKEKLIGMQHFDDPILRLLGIKDITLKRRLHVYSWDTGYACTGLTAEPPQEFIAFVFDKLGLDHKNGGCVCKHIAVEKATKAEVQKKHYVRIHWKSADRIIVLCEDCAKTTKNTVFNLSKYFLTPDLSQDFDVDVVAQVVRHKEAHQEHHTGFLEDYFAGKLTDYTLIQKNVTHQRETLEQAEEKLLVLDGVSYGLDVQQFLDALKPSSYERAGLEHILNTIEEPLIVSNTSPNKILEMYWDQYGQEVITAILDDTQMAKSFSMLDDTPSNILKMVFDYKERQQILSQLPSYRSLPPLARFADHIAKTYKTFGEKKTLGELKKRPDNPKGKSLAYAFFLALGKGKDIKWQFSQVEIEYGEFLQNYAKKLLGASPKQYTKALQALLTASGSTETIA